MSLTLPAGIPRAKSQRKVTQRGSPPARAATQGGGGWANAALSQQLGSVLKQKPMSSLGVRDRSAPRVKKAMLPSRLVAQLTFPEPGTKDQQLYGIGWDVRDEEGTEIALTPPAPAPALLIFVLGSRPRSPVGLRKAEAPLPPAPQRTDTPGPGFMNEIQSCGYK